MCYLVVRNYIIIVATCNVCSESNERVYNRTHALSYTVIMCYQWLIMSC